ncbi:lipase family alpha/beta hydrolase [Serratia aquatilis]|uniref:Lipase family alpha/beta hydrolase n=1 Tax=Serratia aquatilis TaxID=1737515 RepID=A0ABV6EI71_9GAMM
MNNKTENKFIVLPQYDENGRVYYKTPIARADQNLVAVCPKVAEKVIPVIFLPGVMGSNLKNQEGEGIWHANFYQGIDALLWLLNSSKERIQLLDPETTIVDDSGKILYNDQKEKMFPSREKRGWGEAFYKSYGEPLHVLQFMLNDQHILLDNLINGSQRLTTRQQLIGENLNAERGEEALTKAEVKHSYNFLFPVHVFGYNWLQSNVDSAQKLADYIKMTLGLYHGRLALNKVILVTHSMGGLVARHYSENMGGQENILGIVHGVMPDLGSPAAYRRMKTGERGIVGRVIGRNAEQLMPVLAQSPGPLQLLPSVTYGNSWLKIQSEKETQVKPLFDPYKEIYLNNSDWWRLYESGISDGDLDEKWNKYRDIINGKVHDYIEGLSNKYHPNTWAFYGASKDNPSDGSLTWVKKQTFKTTSRLPIQAVAGVVRSATNRVVRENEWQPDDSGLVSNFELVSSDSPGDGTVPVRSGRITSSVIRSLLATDVDHEGAYAVGNIAAGELSVAMKFTLRAIVKMVQEVPACR